VCIKSRRFKPTLDLIPGATFGHLREHKQKDFISGFQSIFAGQAPDPQAAGESAAGVEWTEDSAVELQQRFMVWAADSTHQPLPAAAAAAVAVQTYLVVGVSLHRRGMHAFVSTHWHMIQC
jgi:hypothetical protein